MPSASLPFLAARDLLFRHRDDYAAAYRDFRWPQLSRFNWALDWFDEVSRGNARPALRIETEGRPGTTLSYAQLSESSSRVANALRSWGVQRGDRILVMLGNELPLWETVLAAIKLGAVVIPATTQLTAQDLEDRFVRGKVRHVVVAEGLTDRFDHFPGDYTRIVAGPAVSAP